jgi:hypothetical protein
MTIQEFIQRRATDAAVVLVTAAIVLLLFLLPILAYYPLLEDAWGRGVPLGLGMDGGAVFVRGERDALRYQARPMPADDRALEDWLRRQPGVERVQVKRVEGADPDVSRLLAGREAVEVSYGRRGAAAPLDPPWRELGYGGQGEVGPASAWDFNRADVSVSLAYLLLALATGLFTGLLVAVVWRRRKGRKTAPVERPQSAAAGA